jgi:hypothetical protein
VGKLGIRTQAEIEMKYTDIVVIGAKIHDESTYTAVRTGASRVVGVQSCCHLCKLEMTRNACMAEVGQVHR